MENLKDSIECFYALDAKDLKFMTCTMFISLINEFKNKF